MEKRELARQLVEIHQNIYGSAPTVMAYAPGRIEVLGNHVDYNEGMVLSAAIGAGTCFAISANDGAGLRFYAGNRREQADFDLGEIAPVPGYDWAGYVRGVFYYIAEMGYEIRDWDCSFYGDVPVGAGLSSSAALDVSAAYAAQAMLGIRLDPVEIAKISQAADHNFVGSMSGLLDQFSSIFGEKYHLIHSDFRTNHVFPVGLPDDIRFLLITPDLRHHHAESPYNERRASCEAVAADLAKLMGAEPAGFTLRDVDLPTFQRFRARLPAEAAKRAAHIVEEIDRVRQGLSALEGADMQAFGELMFESHESSRVNFENSLPEQDLLVDFAREAGVPGARLTGGGWGGSTIAMVYEDQAEEIERGVAEFCRGQGMRVDLSLITPSAGAREMSLAEV